MNHRSAALEIIRLMTVAGYLPDQLVSADLIATILTEKGMRLEDIEKGMLSAHSCGWMQASGHFICLTPLGQSIIHAANDNTPR